MNRKLLILLTTGTLLTTVLASAGCSAKKPQETDFQQITVQTQPAATAMDETKTVTTKVTEAGENPVIKLVGRYTCERAVMVIEADGSENAKISITFGGSYDSQARFTMSGKYDANTKTIAYEDGIKTEVIYDENKKTVSEKEVYKDGKGEFLFTEEGVIWNDKMENIAENMIFKFDDGKGSLTGEELDGSEAKPTAKPTVKPTTKAKPTTKPATKKAKTTTKPTNKTPTEAPKPTEAPREEVCEPLSFEAPYDVGEPAIAPEEPTVTPAEPTKAPKPVEKPFFKYGKSVYVYKAITANVTIKNDNSVSVVITDNTNYDGKTGTQYFWTFSGVVDPKTGALKYSDCTMHYYVETSVGVMANRVNYLKGTGSIKFNKDMTFTWKDNIDDAGKDKTFRLSKYSYTKEG